MERNVNSGHIVPRKVTNVNICLKGNMTAMQTSSRNKPKRSYHHGDLRNAAVAEAVRAIGQTRSTDFTLRQLAARLRVTSTALYRHFPSKLALLAAVADQGFRALTQLSRRHDALLDTDPVACLREHGLEYVRFALRNPAHFRVMFLPELARTVADFPALHDSSQALYRELKNALEACQRRGLLNDFSIDAIALTLWATVHGTSTLLLDGQVRLGKDGAASEQEALAVVAQILRILREGVLRAAPAKQRARPQSAGTKARRPARARAA